MVPTGQNDKHKDGYQKKNGAVEKQSGDGHDVSGMQDIF